MTSSFASTQFWIRAASDHFVALQVGLTHRPEHHSSDSPYRRNSVYGQDPYSRRRQHQPDDRGLTTWS